jgi:predicted chitinase
MPGPLGTSTNDPIVDEGTLCRHASSTPGTTCQTKPSHQHRMPGFHHHRAPISHPPQGCACNRDITLDELRKVFVKQKRKVCERYLPHINSTCKTYGITTCLRKAHFLAQIGHESGELHYTAEELPEGKNESDVYDGYKGRGLIQITYLRNYKAYGKSVHHDFLKKHRKQLEQPAWATDSAGWYWTKGDGQDLSGLADKNDLLAITARVNGAFNGFEDRKKHLQSAFTTLKVRNCDTAGIGNQTFLPFKDSDIYSNIIQAFAWGCWNDQTAGKSGVDKSAEQQKQGYLRFLELSKQLGQTHGKGPMCCTIKGKHHHFAFSPEKMQSLATEGSK